MNGVNIVFFFRGNIFCDIIEKYLLKWNFLEFKGLVYKMIVWKMLLWEWVIVLEWNYLWVRKDIDNIGDLFVFLYLLKV